MKQRKPPSIVVIRQETFPMDCDSESPSIRKGTTKENRDADCFHSTVSDSSSRRILRRGRQWLKAKGGRSKPMRRSFNFRPSFQSNTESTDLIELSQEFGVPRPASPEETVPVAEPSGKLKSTKKRWRRGRYHTTSVRTENLSKSRGEKLPKQSQTNSDPLETTNEPSEKGFEPREANSNRTIEGNQTMLDQRETIQPLQSKLTQEAETTIIEEMTLPLRSKLTPQFETIDECKPIQPLLKQMKGIEESTPTQQTPDLLNKRVRWEPIPAKLLGTEDSHLSIDTIDELVTQSKPKQTLRSAINRKSNDQEAIQPKPKRTERRKASIKQDDKPIRMERRNAIIAHGDECKFLRKLILSNSKRIQSKTKKTERQKRKSSRGRPSKRRCFIGLQNVAGRPSKSSIPESAETKAPKAGGSRIKISNGSALIFLSGIITTVLVMQLSMIIDEWLASRIPEDMEWPMILDEWLSFLTQDGTHIS